MDEPIVSLKSKVEREVVDQIIASLNNGSLKVEEAQQVAKETIATIDAVERQERSVVDFYQNLAEKHSQFEILYTKVKGDILRMHEESEYKKALSAINSGDMSGASLIAQGAIVKTANETNIDN